MLNRYEEEIRLLHLKVDTLLLYASAAGIADNQLVALDLDPLFASPGLDACYCRNWDFLYLGWKGLQTEETVWQGCRAVLGILSKHPFKKILNDYRRVVGPRPAIGEWIGTDFFPQMLSAGLTHVACVAPAGADGRAIVDWAGQVGEQFTNISAFQDFGQARTWLLTKGHQST